MLPPLEDIVTKTLPFLLIGLPALFTFILLVVVIRVFSLKNKNRKNPLTQNLLRSPGQAILGLITDLQFKFIEVIFLWCFLPIVFYALSLNVIVAQKSVVLLLAAMLIAIAFVSYGSVRTYAILKRLADLRLAYDGELSVGQELNDLMLDGFRVFHDIQAEGFNIDHAVVGPSGVFAIETKTRAKRSDAKGKDAVKVLYDGDSINFPQWKDTKMLEQAKSNAQWLLQKLTSATGEQVDVYPAVAIPGWHTEKTTKKFGPIVYNGQSPRKIFPKCGLRTPLTAEQIHRIAHQMEQLCRNVKPITFNEEK